MDSVTRHVLALWLLCAGCSAGTDTRTTSEGAPSQTSGDVDSGGALPAPEAGAAGVETDANVVDATITPPKSDAGAQVTPGTPKEEVCDTGVDEDLDGLVDESCLCKAGSMQTCYIGPPDRAGQICPAGVQHCRGSEFAAWGPCESTGAPFPTNACECFPEICGNNKDDNCNQQVDEGCVVVVPVDIDGDCVKASCPAWAPYPVGCKVVMDGGDDRGCVASTVTGSEVYFQEGDVCGAGHVMGTLTCSSQPGAALDQQNCALNKSKKLFVQRSDQCP